MGIKFGPLTLNGWLIKYDWFGWVIGRWRDVGFPRCISPVWIVKDRTFWRLFKHPSYLPHAVSWDRLVLVLMLLWSLMPRWRDVRAVVHLCCFVWAGGASRVVRLPWSHHARTWLSRREPQHGISGWGGAKKGHAMSLYHLADRTYVVGSIWSLFISCGYSCTPLIRV